MNDYIIEITNLSKKYDEEILKNVNIKIKRGEAIGIVGKSGNGKTTLLKCIDRLLNFEEGTIKYNGLDITKIEPTKLRKDVGIVFQEYNLFEHLNVLENLTIALTKVKKIDKLEAINMAEARLDKYGLLNKKNHYPYELSGGQKQRIAIIRTLLMDPKVIMLDEPTAALDINSKKEIIKAIKELSKNNITLIIVSHEEKVIKKVCDRIFEIEKCTLKEM